MSICRASGEYLERCQRRVLGAAFVSIILAIEFHAPRQFLEDSQRHINWLVREDALQAFETVKKTQFLWFLLRNIISSYTIIIQLTARDLVRINSLREDDRTHYKHALITGK